ncbi:MAG TPA: RNA-binding protein [Nitrospirales bacterium]|nr:RNA-binding protein [Nitrospirales bacterium]
MPHYLCIDGLPLTVTDGDLHLLLSSVGHVEWAKVVRDPCGHSLRFGLAEMRLAPDAAKAEESLNDKLFCRQRLRVAIVDAHVVEALPQIAALLDTATAHSPAKPSLFPPT